MAAGCRSSSLQSRANANGSAAAGRLAPARAWFEQLGRPARPGASQHCRHGWHELQGAAGGAGELQTRRASRLPVAEQLASWWGARWCRCAGPDALAARRARGGAHRQVCTHQGACFACCCAPRAPQHCSTPPASPSFRGPTAWDSKKRCAGAPGSTMHAPHARSGGCRARRRPGWPVHLACVPQQAPAGPAAPPSGARAASPPCQRARPPWRPVIGPGDGRAAGWPRWGAAAAQPAHVWEAAATAGGKCID